MKMGNRVVGECVYDLANHLFIGQETFGLVNVIEQAHHHEVVDVKVIHPNAVFFRPNYQCHWERGR